METEECTGETYAYAPKRVAPDAEPYYETCPEEHDDRGDYEHGETYLAGANPNIYVLRVGRNLCDKSELIKGGDIAVSKTYSYSPGGICHVFAKCGLVHVAHSH